MASLFIPKRSPFFWIKYRDGQGNLKRVGTGLRHDNNADRFKAKKLKLQRTMEELDGSTIGSSARGENWSMWVLQFLETRYRAKESTLRRYRHMWKNLSVFLAEKKIFVPRMLQRADCFEYLRWRKQPQNGKTRHAGTKSDNTDRMELVLLGGIMREAVLRGYAAANPCLQLQIPRQKPRRKPSLTDVDIAFIREKIALEAEPRRSFFHLSFEIALHQGCRMRETCVWLDDVTTDGVAIKRADGSEVKTGAIVFRDTKTGQDHAAVLHPSLIGLFTELKRLRPGHQRAFEWPASAGLIWWRFFHGHRLSERGISFHCTRVTAATRLNGIVREQIAQDFIGHKSAQVHRGYVRLSVLDQGSCVQALDFAPAPAQFLSGCSDTVGRSDPHARNQSK